MAHTNGKITAPISLRGDVATVLGVQSTDVATVCLSDRINPYALYSPRWTLDPASRITRDWTSPQTPPTSSGGVHYALAPYGVYIPVVSNSLNDLEAFHAARYPWVIQRPDSNSFLCLQHFDNYDHNATVEPIAESVYAVDGRELLVNINLPQADGGSLSLANLFGQPDSQGNRYYLCIVVYESKSGTAYDFTKPVSVVRSTKYITEQGLTEAIYTNVDATAGHYYTIVPLVCKKVDGGTDLFPTDYEFYGTKLADNISPWIDRYVPTEDENIPQLQYFWWMESHGCYPDGSTVDNGTPLPSGVTTDLVFDYCENPGNGSTLWAKYRCVVLNITCHDNAGNTAAITLTWDKGNTITPLQVDERCYSRGGYEHHLLMYATGVWEQAYAKLGTRNVTIANITATLTDSSGIAYDPVTATQRPDDN